jgi:hypothetical protein
LHHVVTDVVDKAQLPAAPKIEVKPIMFRDDKNSRALSKTPA